MDTTTMSVEEREEREEDLDRELISAEEALDNEHEDNEETNDVEGVEEGAKEEKDEESSEDPEIVERAKKICQKKR